MRIRSTKPEFWRSKLIASVDWETRFVLKALESYVDDNGVGKDDLELIVSDTFSRDLTREPSRTLKRVQVAVDTLAEAGLLWRYVAGGNDLLYVSFWESTQYINRPSKGRLPRPDGTMEYGDSQIGAPVLSPQEPSSNFSAGTGEQGIRGTGSQTGQPADDEPNPQPEFGVPALLASMGMSTAERPKFLAALKSGGVRNTGSFINALHRDGKLAGRIQEWREDTAADDVAEASRPVRHNTADDEHLKTCTRCRRMVGLEDGARS